LAEIDFCNALPTDTVQSRNRLMAFFRCETNSNVFDFIFCQNMRTAPGSSIGGAMKQFIGFVFNGSGPAQMSRVEATNITFSAAMCGFMLWCWRLAVNAQAEISANKNPRKLVNRHLDLAKLFWRNVKRPHQAIIVFVCDGGFKKYLNLGKWLTVLHSNIEVSLAQASENGILAAAFNRAYTGISQLSLLSRFGLGEKPLDGDTSGGFAISSL
jgi:hypothetical protein